MVNPAQQNPDQVLSDLRAQLDAALSERRTLDGRIQRIKDAITSLQGVAPSRGAAVGLGAPLPPQPYVSPPAAVRPVFPMPSVDVGAMQRMSPEQLDSLAYGVITVDSRGRVLGYNDTESRMVGLPRSAVLSRNFFTELAPCTRIKEFEGRFQDFVHGRKRVRMVTFDFVFRFEHGHQNVLVMITPARYRGQFQISIIRR